LLLISLHFYFVGEGKSSYLPPWEQNGTVQKYETIKMNKQKYNKQERSESRNCIVLFVTFSDVFFLLFSGLKCGSFKMGARFK